MPIDIGKILASVPDTPSANKPAPTFLERQGGVRGLAGTGVRTIAGLLSGLASSSAVLDGPIGPALGGAIGGAGEAAAEAIEGSKLNPGRMAVEAGLGAVPFGAILKEGHPLASFLRGAAFSGAGTAGRDLATTGNVDPRAVGESALMGGAVNGGLGWLLKGKTPPAEPKPMMEIQPTSQTGPGTGGLSGGKITYGARNKADKLSGAEYKTEIQAPAAIRSEGMPTPSAAINPVVAGATKAIDADQLQTGTPYGGDVIGTSSGRVAKLASKDAAAQTTYEDTIRKVLSKSLGSVDSSAADLNSLDKEIGIANKESAQARALSARREAGYQRVEAGADLSDVKRTLKLEPDERPLDVGGNAPSALTDEKYQSARNGALKNLQHISESPSNVAPPNLEWLGRSEPKSVDPTNLTHDLGHEMFPAQLDYATKGPEGVSNFNDNPPNLERLGTSDPHENIDPNSPALLRFFQNRLEAAGDNYGLVKKAKAAGEAVPEQGRAMAGQLAQRERVNAGVPPPLRPAKPTAPPVPPSASKPIDGMAQTSKAREAALAKRKISAPPPVIPAEPPPPTTASVKFMTTNAEFKAMRDLGYTPAQYNKMSPDEISNILASKAGPTPSGPTTSAPPPAEDWVQQESKAVDRLKSEKGEISTKLLARLLLGGVGAMGGAGVAGPDHRLMGALIGGAAGAAFPSLANVPQALKTASNLNESEANDTIGKFTRKAAAIQRFNYLSDPVKSLLPNAVFGPWGSAAMGGLEAALSGDKRGVDLLKRVANPFKLASEVRAQAPAAYQEALSSIGRGEGKSAHDMASGVNSPSRWRRSVAALPAAPGTYMTTGDIISRNIMRDAKFTEEEARRMTMTNEPQGFWQGPQNLVRSHPAWQLLLPFSRTPANIVQSGIERMPGIGFLSHLGDNTTLRQKLVQQGLGAGVGVAGYAAGSNVDPETMKYLRPYLSNAAGQYGLLMNMGLAAGQANQKGGSLGKQVLAGTTKGIQDLPIPALDTPISWATALAHALDPTVGSPQAAIPKGVMPNLLRDLLISKKP